MAILGILFMALVCYIIYQMILMAAAAVGFFLMLFFGIPVMVAMAPNTAVAVCGTIVYCIFAFLLWAFLIKEEPKKDEQA
jgi:predicted RND superfamily exporter protein